MDRPYTMNEAAKLLGMSRRLFQDFVQRHPHYCLVGRRKKIFYPEDIEALRQAQREETKHQLAAKGYSTPVMTPTEARL
jgi:predicted DNA-binding protein (UPF0251 family)